MSDPSPSVPWSLHLEVAINVGGMKSNTSGKDQGREHPLLLCWASLYLRVPLQSCFSSGARPLHDHLLGQRPPSMAAVFEQGNAAVPLLVGGVGFVQLSVLVPLHSYCKPRRRERDAPQQTMTIGYYPHFAGRAQQFRCCEGVIEALNTKS